MVKKIALAVLVASVLGLLWYWQQSPKTTPKANRGDPKISSEIQGIQALKTNPQTGQIEYRLQAASLTQSTDGNNTLRQVVMDWTPMNGEHYTIHADLGQFDEKTGEFVFYNGFSLQQHTKDEPLTLVGDTLTGNTQTKLIKSDTPLQVTQGQHAFLAQAMRGDLTQKDYEFDHIQAEFSPPERKDMALF